MITREALAQEWRQRLEDFAQSDMTVEQWCDFNRVSPHQYYYWRRKLNADKTDNAKKAQWMQIGLLDTTPQPTTHTAITLRIAGADIQVNPDFDPALLRAVVSALATKPC